MRVAQPIELTENEIKTLSSWSRGRRTPTRSMKRAKIVLMAEPATYQQENIGKTEFRIRVVQLK
jgi:hypothetical protein